MDVGPEAVDVVAILPVPGTVEALQLVGARLDRSEDDRGELPGSRGTHVDDVLLFELALKLDRRLDALGLVPERGEFL